MNLRRSVWGSCAFALSALACNEKHATVPVGEAAKHEAAAELTLTDAKILFDLGGRYDRVCTSHTPTTKGASGCVDHHFYVFPVVPTTWSKNVPVPAWVTCSGKEQSYEDCERAVRAHGGELRGAVAVRVGDGAKPTRAMSGWETAIEDAVTRGGLAAAPRGPVLRLGK